MYELNFSFKAIFKSFQENKPEMVYLQMIAYQIALIPRKLTDAPVPLTY